MPCVRDRLANILGRIVEYATREQAQNAVATLSNQNLMGRLVYVREVRDPESPALVRSLTARDRIVKQSLGSLAPREETAEALPAARLRVAVTAEAEAEAEALASAALAVLEVPEAAAASFTLPTFVSTSGSYRDATCCRFVDFSWLSFLIPSVGRI
jgi:hypothetical protein